MTVVSISPRVSDTPEDLFSLAPGSLPEFPIDALTCALDRAASILRILSGDGGDLDQGFAIAHLDVLNTIWCAEGLIAQARALAIHASQEAQS